MPRELTRRRRSTRDADTYTASGSAEDEYTADDDPDTAADEEQPRRGSRRRGAATASSNGRASHNGRARREPEPEPEPERGASRRGVDRDERARGRRQPAAEAPSRVAKPTVLKGWGSYKKVAEETKSGDFADEFKPEDDGTETLIKILDDEPFAVWKQHWIERGPGNKKSFNCIADKGSGCPLCDDLGDKPRLQAMFNVVDLLDDDPQVLIWRVGKMVSDILENHSKNERTSPLSRDGLYFSVSKTVKGTGKGKKSTFNINPVKERDLVEDWEIDPLTEAEFEDFYNAGYGEDEVHMQTRSELQEIVNEVMEYQ